MSLSFLLSSHRFAVGTRVGDGAAALGEARALQRDRFFCSRAHGARLRCGGRFVRHILAGKRCGDGFGVRQTFCGSQTCGSETNSDLTPCGTPNSRRGELRQPTKQPLSYEEYSYLFKVLSFGSANMDDHPQLASMVQEFPTVLRGSLVSVHAFADILKRNMRPQFWLSVLDRCRGVVESNLSIFGEHPKLLLERSRPTDIARFVSPSASPMRLMPPRSEAKAAERPLPRVKFGELIVNPSILPRGDFDLVTWESRIAPYSKYVHFVPASFHEDKPEMLSTKRKLPTVFV
ncbi:hypothetical protein ACP70R_019782 [Stipagrostis hirtigluma subsp. patula]